ncbi:MAG: VWA domain-containing protein [Cellvibrionaceae bacterium]|nr:VWA domain-containing protein [Cellvibrionaceae bacterium]
MSLAPQSWANTSGVELVPGPLDLASFKWRLRAEASGQTSSTLDKYGVIHVAPGSYQLEFAQGIRNWLPLTKLTVSEGSIGKYSPDTGVALQLPEGVTPGLWKVVDSKNYIAAEIRNSAAAVALPPGSYSIYIGEKGQEPIEHSKLELKAGQLAAVTADTRFRIKAHAQLPAPVFWQLAKPGSRRDFTVVKKRWGSALLPAGKYELLIKLANNSTIEYGVVDVAPGKDTVFQLDSGLALKVDKPNSRTTLLVYRQGESKAIYSTDFETVSLPLRPGNYQVVSFSNKHYSWGPAFRVEPGQITSLSPSFETTESAQQAEVLEPDFQSPGLNIASRALGGAVLSVSSQDGGKDWQGDKLIDGFDALNASNKSSGCDKSCGWRSERDELSPHSVTLGFYQQRLATLDSVIIDSALHSNMLPRRISVQVSTESPESGFVEVADALLQQTLRPQRIILPAATQAKYLKLVVTSSFGYPAVSFGEVSVIESNSSESIVSEMEFDLSRPELGGSLVWFSSQQKNKYASSALWKQGYFSGSRWESGKSQVGGANYLPQDFVLAFNGRRSALVDRVIIDPSSLGLGNTKIKQSFAKEVVIEGSMRSPIDGFEELARIQLQAEAKAQSFAINKTMRFLRLRVTQTHGQVDFVSLGKVSVIEAKQPGYRSVLAGGGDRGPAPQTAEASVAATSLVGEVSELEPNNSQAEANPLGLGQTHGGVISPLGESDYYRLSLAKPAVVTAELRSEPSIQTHLSVQTGDAKPLYEFSPDSLVSNSKKFSLHMPAGDYFYRLSQAPHSIVLIWDTSGSMQGNEKDLAAAVNKFIQNVGATAQLQLITFSNNVKVLNSEFSSDAAVLTKAAKGNFGAYGGTRLYDAIEKGMALLASEKGNKAIVVMTDGQDSGSRLPYHDLWQRVKNEKISLYTVGLGDILNQYSPKIGGSGMQLLANLSESTRAKSLYAERSEELDALYQSIMSALTDKRPYSLAANIDNRPGLLRLTTGDKLLENTVSSHFEIILDASGSMRSNKNRIDGELKIDVAKKVLGDIVRKLPDSSDLAFRVFGHRVKEYAPGDCEDSELIYPLGKVNKQQLIGAVNKINVRAGTTPLTYSMVQAAKDLASVSGEKHIVVVTDGEEYCGASPEATVKQLIEMGFNIRLDIVGIDLKQQQLRDSMKRVAQISGGQFYNVQTNRGFAAAIESVLGASYRVADSAGNEVAKGRVNGEPIKLPQGFYTIEVGSETAPLAMGEVTVSADQLTTIDIVKNGALVERASSKREAASDQHWAQAQKAVAEAVANNPGISPEQARAALEQLQAEVLAAKAKRPQAK